MNQGSGLTQILRSDENDVCVPAIDSGNIVVTATTLTMIFAGTADVDTTLINLTRHDLDGEVIIEVEDKISVVENADPNTIEQYVVIADLRPGYRYTITVQYDDNLILDEVISEGLETIVVPTVLSCSGDSSTGDLTGRPRNLQILQKSGHVMFEFLDNSLCEEAFSFSRSSEVDEFLTDFTKGGVSFTSDYYYSASQPYESLIKPELEASDDLRLAELEVGKQYAYCVRAIRQDHYMDSPYEGINERRLLTSSQAACAAYTIAWEASIDGLVTTEPNAVSSL